MISGQASIEMAVRATRLGAVDFLEKPFQREHFLAVLARLQRFRQMGQKIERLEREVTESKAQNPEPVFKFSTPLMQEAMEILLRAATVFSRPLNSGSNWDRRTRSLA